MPDIHEVATLTSKGQITLPKPIRQALGVDVGGKVAFDLRGGEVVVTRADAEHEDPAIAAFLTLLARDIEAGRNIRGLPEDLARTMLEHAGHTVNLDEEIEGEVAI
jgi:antitoxin PrlF